jgi:HD-like signal output (HDOD) protein/ActR/RegA family two-component response regulator
MSTKTILLAVADRQALVDITQALGDGWEATSVSDEVDALAQLEQRTFDALLVDFNLGSPNASQLLNDALEKRPETIRFLLAYEADLALVAAYVSGTHEILPKPVEPASLKNRIERGVAPHDSNRNVHEGGPGVGDSASPAVPAVYSKVLKALDLPGVTKSQVGEIIAEDTALTYEVLRLTKSAYLGLPRNITDPVKAVEPMGLETVKALVMALRFLAEHSQLKPGYLSLEKIWQHSTKVGKLARDLMLFETKDRGLAAEALVAGLLHDLGKVVLASNFDDLYGRVHSLARNQPVAMWDIEKEMFGASHGEIGGCLAGMWNMPSSVVQAVAFHHEPPLGEHQHLTPLAAIHIANVLEHEIRPSDEFRVAPVISTAFLNDIGLLQRLPVWRAVFANRRNASASPEVEATATSPFQLFTPAFSGTPPPLTANQLPAPTAETRTATLGQPGSDDGVPVAPPSHQRRWVYAGAAAAALGFLILWFGTRPNLAVRAQTPEPTANRASVVMSPAPASEPAPAAVLATPAIAVSEEAPGTNAVLAPNPATTLAGSQPTVGTAPQHVTATNAPPATPATEEKARPDFRLNGIIYTVARPVAIVNGQTVCVGDSVSGATIAAIDRNFVTLQINGRKTYVFLQETH